MSDVSNVRVVVVAFHAADLLAHSLDALRGCFPIIIVDNSSDPKVQQVARRHQADYIDVGANLGFASGANVGIRAAGPGADILLLNPDATVSPTDIADLHRQLYAVDSRAAVSPTLRSATHDQTHRATWPFPSPVGLWAEALGVGRFMPPRPSFVVGAVLMLRANALAHVGLFDERFFLYAEETDWQRRAVAAGWSCAEVRDVTATHLGAGTSTDPARREALFHAGTETYVRKWFGLRGWVSYRAAALCGAAIRTVLPGATRREAARARLRLYARGPRRVAGLPPRPAAAVVGRRITHVVVTNAFAGVERYVCEIAKTQASLGSAVVVIGGDAVRMRRELGTVPHKSATSMSAALGQLLRLRRSDVVHVHMTAAELAACAVNPWRGPIIVATRHFARSRGSGRATRMLGRWVRARLDGQIAISQFVADRVGEPTRVLLSGVAPQPERDGTTSQTVLCLQRLEAEKSTEVALHAWGLSSARQRGWRLLIAGDGSQRPALEAMADGLGLRPSVDFLGHVDDTDSQLRRAGLLLATADAEPFGLSVAEAMATGVPVLASDGGAHPELLGPQGWFFRAGDVASLVGAMDEATSRSVQERNDYGNLLRARQQGWFDLNRHAEDLNGTYHLFTSIRAERRVGPATSRRPVHRNRDL